MPTGRPDQLRRDRDAGSREKSLAHSGSSRRGLEQPFQHLSGHETEQNRDHHSEPPRQPLAAWTLLLRLRLATMPFMWLHPSRSPARAAKGNDAGVPFSSSAAPRKGLWGGGS